MIQIFVNFFKFAITIFAFQQTCIVQSRPYGPDERIDYQPRLVKIIFQPNERFEFPVPRGDFVPHSGNYEVDQRPYSLIRRHSDEYEGSMPPYDENEQNNNIQSQENISPEMNQPEAEIRNNQESVPVPPQDVGLEEQSNENPPDNFGFIQENQEFVPPSEEQPPNEPPLIENNEFEQQQQQEQLHEINTNSDETIDQIPAENIAFSYNHIQTHPLEQRLPSMGFVFHPTILRVHQPNLVYELRHYALQLDKSPIMNALFSPSTVPIPPSFPIWPSKFVAKHYLPPDTLQQDEQTQNDASNMRRKSDGEQFNMPEISSPNAIQQSIHESIEKSKSEFRNLMKKSMMDLPAFPDMKQEFASQSNKFNNFFQSTFQPSNFMPPMKFFPTYRMITTTNGNIPSQHVFIQNPPPPVHNQYFVPNHNPYLYNHVQPADDEQQHAMKPSLIQIGSGNTNVVEASLANGQSSVVQMNENVDNMLQNIDNSMRINVPSAIQDQDVDNEMVTTTEGTPPLETTTLFEQVEEIPRSLQIMNQVKEEDTTIATTENSEESTSENSTETTTLDSVTETTDASA